MVNRIILFIVTNGFGTLIDTLVLWVFSAFVFDTYVGDYIISPIISFEAAVLCNFFSSYFLIWKNRVSKRNFRSFIRHYLAYNLTSSGVFVIKMGFLLLFEFLFSWNVIICNLLALCISGSINYAISEWIIFKQKR